MKQMPAFGADDGGAGGDRNSAPDKMPGTEGLAALRHGMANSLQMLAGLMRVRITAVEDQAICLELEEQASRVHGMAAVYRALELRNGYMHVAVHRLLNDLCDVHRGSSWLPNIKLFCHAETFLMPLEDAMPLAVLTSEIIAAAVKRDRRTGGGTIDVHLTRRDRGDVRLEVIDDGFELPPKPSRDAGGSLGWNAVSAMARQIGAVIERSADDRRITLILKPSKPG